MVVRRRRGQSTARRARRTSCPLSPPRSRSPASRARAAAPIRHGATSCPATGAGVRTTHDPADRGQPQAPHESHDRASSTGTGPTATGRCAREAPAVRRYALHLTLDEAYGDEPAPTFDGASISSFDDLDALACARARDPNRSRCGPRRSSTTPSCSTAPRAGRPIIAGRASSAPRRSCSTARRLPTWSRRSSSRRADRG